MNFINYFYLFREAAGEFISRNILLLEFLSLVFSGLFLWGIIYILTKLHYFNMKTEQFLNILGSTDLTRRRSLKGWKQIQKRLGTDDSQQWKIAILEADQILNEILKMSGYLGRMEEKLEIITPVQLANVEEVKLAHRIRDQVTQDPIFELTREAAQHAIDIYRRSFIELNLIEE